MTENATTSPATGGDGRRARGTRSGLGGSGSGRGRSSARRTTGRNGNSRGRPERHVIAAAASLRIEDEGSAVHDPVADHIEARVVTRLEVVKRVDREPDVARACGERADRDHAPEEVV